MCNERENLLREYVMWEETANAVRRDLERIMSGQTIGYSVDFSVLFPYLWGHSGTIYDHPRHARWDATCRSVCLELFKYELPAKTRFVLTSVSFIEAVDYVYRHVQRQVEIRADWSAHLAQLRAEVDGAEQVLSTAVANDRRQLEEKLDHISRRFGIGAPQVLGRLRSFIVPGGPLVGIRDVISSSLRMESLAERFTELYAEMERTRGNSLSETRTPEERSFHYKVDCANIVLCEGVARAHSNIALGFVTRASNKRTLVREHGRTSLMVLLMLRLNRLTEYKDLSERYRLLGYMAMDCQRIIEEINRRADIDLNRHRYLARCLSKFRDDYKKLVLDSETELMQQAIGSRVASLKEVSSNEARYRESFDASIDAATQDLRQIVDDHSGLLDDELLTTFKIDTDPRAQRILSR